MEPDRYSPKANSTSIHPWDFDPATIRIPLSIWHGSDDLNLPCKLAKKLAARIPSATTHWVDGAGHYSLPALHADEILDELERQR